MSLFNQGENLFLATVLTGSAVPFSNFYIGLMSDQLTSFPALNTTLANIIQYEPTTAAPGYIRQQVNRDATGLGWQLALNGGIWTATSPTMTITATGNWTVNIVWAFLTTTQTPGDSSGLLIAMAPIDPVQPAQNDNIRVKFVLNLQ